MHISEVRISDFKIIEQMSASFGPRLNVITGETGAGKTILVDAIGFALGERASRDLVRAGSDEAAVEVTLDLVPEGTESSAARRLHAELLQLLEGLLDSQDEVLVLKRTMTQEGRSRAYVNYRPAPISLLQKVGDLLVDFHGQHEHQRLFSTRYQLLTLDEFGGLSDLRSDVSRLYESFKEVDARISTAESKHHRADEEKELLEFYVRELEQARLKQGEIESLQDEKRRLLNAEKLAKLFSAVEETLYSEPRSVCEALSTLVRQLSNSNSNDESVSTMTDKLAEARFVLEELARDARKQCDSLYFDADRLEAVEDRLAELSSLGRKHRCQPDGLIDKLNEFRTELEGYEEASVQVEHLIRRRDELAAELRQKAAQLSDRRQSCASRLSAAVKTNLRELAMQASDFGVDFGRQSETSADDTKVPNADLPGSDGFDHIEFVIKTNPGQPLLPLRKTASGGEVSRTMLALKVALAGADDVPVMVFDELDTGIGGAAALHVGRMLRSLSSSRQILVISHLVHIARFAEKHLAVTKHAEKDTVRIDVSELEGKSRVDEIARMLGSEGQKDAHEFARRLLSGGD